MTSDTSTTNDNQASRLPRRRTLLLALAVTLALLLITLFHPRFQRWLVLEQAAPHVEQLELEYLHVLPWSVHARGVTVAAGGIGAAVAAAEIRFQPLALLAGRLSVRLVDVQGAEVDLRSLPPAADDEAAAPFPGLLHVLDSGYEIRLDKLNVSASALLPGGADLTLGLAGGGVAPGMEGGIEVDAALRLAEGSPVSTVRLAGRVALTQRDVAGFQRLSAQLTAAVTPAQLVREERVQLNVSVEPAAAAADAGASSTTSETAAVPRPERLVADIMLLGDGGDGPARLHLDGVYRGADGHLDGAYSIAVDDRLLRPYLDAEAMPSLAEQGTGTFSVDLAGGRAALELGGELVVSALDRTLGPNAALPSELTAANDIRIEFADGTLLVSRFSTLLKDGDGTELLSLLLTAPLAVAGADPWSALAEDRTLLTLRLSGVPLTWFSERIPDATLVAGSASGSFEVAAAAGALRLISVAGLRLNEAELRLGDDPALRFNAGLTPDLTLTRERLNVSANDVFIDLGDARVVDAGASASLALGGDDARPVGVLTHGRVLVNEALSLPFVAGAVPPLNLPDGLVLDFETDGNVAGQRVSINSLEARLQSDGAPPVVALTTRQPFEFVLGPDAPPIANPGGELASVELQGLKAEWFDGLVPDLKIRGRISDARFTLASPGADTLVLAPERALAVADLTVTRGKQVLVQDIDLEIVPDVTYEPGKLQVLYKQLDVKGRSRPLLTGSGEFKLAGLDQETTSTGAAGTLRFFSDGLAALPAAASAMGEDFGAAQLRGAFSYALDRTGDRIDIAELDGTIAIDGTPRITLAAATPLVVRTTLAGDENLAGHVTGSMRVGIDGLTSAMLAGILPPSGVSFAAVNGAAELNSDGRRLTAQVTEPLAVDDVRISGEDGLLLRPFSIAMAADLLAQGRHYEAALSKLTLNFAGDEQPAVAGRLSFSVEPDHPIPLRRLAANLNGDLPAVLEQPVVLPGHALKAGSLVITAQVAEDGSIRSSTRLGELSADAALAVTDFVIEATGRMAPDGRGFTLNMPLTGTGRTGDSDALIEASYAPQPGKDARIDVAVTSEQFFLNDLLASIDAVKQPRRRPAKGKDKDGSAAPAEQVAAAAPVIDDTPDDKAFWNVLAPDMQVSLSIDELRYADNLSFNDIRGRFALTDTRLGLTDIAARYHDSPLRFDGAVDFSAGVADPYRVALEGGVKEFDLNRFFTELRPGVTPRLEGLFGVDISAYGEAPNAGQFRNRILFDMALTSRDGVYRPLDPDSALVAGASGALGLVGEGLSYLPTSGFGAGAVARLVSYIGEIDYDIVDVRIARKPSLDLSIEQFLVQSPNVRLSAEGGVTHVPGRDVLDSPLSLQANLNMRGKGAAILHSLDLLEDEQDSYSYWKGPEYAVTGTVLEQSSNLEAIIETARDGALQGGITRPFAGLIGNIKHRWLGGGADTDAPAADAGADEKTGADEPADDQAASAPEEVVDNAGL